jgi:Putative Mg2+ and Co2+ transporter CorC
VRALASIEDFDNAYGTHFCDDEVDPISGLLMHAFGHLSARGASIDLPRYQFLVALSVGEVISMSLSAS